MLAPERTIHASSVSSIADPSKPSTVPRAGNTYSYTFIRGQITRTNYSTLDNVADFVDNFMVI